MVEAMYFSSKLIYIFSKKLLHLKKNNIIIFLLFLDPAVVSADTLTCGECRKNFKLQVNFNKYILSLFVLISSLKYCNLVDKSIVVIIIKYSRI